MNNFFFGFWKFIIRTTAFIRREVFSVIRQPQLLITLILGPFIILLLFGIGYRNEPRSLRTLIVVNEGSDLRSWIESMAPHLGPQLVFEGVVSDAGEALRKLRDGEVDLVAVAPENAIETIQSGKQAEFTIYHREIDPFQVSYVSFFAKTYLDEVNRRILLNVTQQGQVEAQNLQGDLDSAQQNASAAKEAIKNGDELTARYHLTRLAQNLDQISLAAGASLAVLSNVEQAVGVNGSSQANEILQMISDIQGLNTAAQSNQLSNTNQGDWQAQVDQIITNLDNLKSNLNSFTALDPKVILSPFTSNTKSIAADQPTSTQFYAPAVIALLLQHLVVTTAALSTVQERRYGTMELFRVSPLSAIEILIGKYLGYLVFASVIAALLTSLLYFLLKMPMLGSWWYYSIVIAMLMFASLGIGFMISLVSQSDSQAVQYTMIVLLCSVFFSGFIMDLDYIWKPIKILSWSLPTTYGTVMLREIGLRGNSPDPILLGGLFAIGVVTCLIAWILLRRQMIHR
jgi:ABC-2 type transport system permease protein